MGSITINYQDGWSSFKRTDLFYNSVETHMIKFCSDLLHNCNDKSLKKIFIAVNKEMCRLAMEHKGKMDTITIRGRCLLVGESNDVSVYQYGIILERPEYPLPIVFFEINEPMPKIE